MPSRGGKGHLYAETSSAGGDTPHGSTKLPLRKLISLEMLTDVMLCVWRRFFNRHQALTDTANHTVSIVCVLDLLQHLAMCGVMHTEDKHRAFR